MTVHLLFKDGSYRELLLVDVFADRAAVIRYLESIKTASPIVWVHDRRVEINSDCFTIQEHPIRS